jgi:hypothetical protein
MALNPYHNHYVSVNEQNLTDSLIIEAIQFKGVEVKYMPRTHNNYNSLLGEDPTSSFESCTVIEMYPAEVNGFGGDGELMSKFGLEIKDTATFIVNKTRFKQEFPNMIRPREGDLLFMPYTNAILEIKFVNHESPFFQQGRQYVYELKVETFELSHENVATGDVGIDDLFDGILNFDSATETEPFGDNQDITDEYEPKTSFDPANPFGVN